MLCQTNGTPTVMEPAPILDEEIKDPGYCDLWGHILGKNKKNIIRTCFQNVRGIIPKTKGNLIRTVLQHFTQQHNIDIFSFAKHNICWDLVSKQNQVAEHTKGWWENAQWSTSFNKQEANPTKHQPGGTGLVVLNKFSHRALKPGGDTSGMGQWSWIHLHGQAGQVLSVVLVYQPCYSTGPLSTYQQQVCYLSKLNWTNSPKMLFTANLTSYFGMAGGG